MTKFALIALIHWEARGPRGEVAADRQQYSITKNEELRSKHMANSPFNFVNSP